MAPDADKLRQRNTAASTEVPEPATAATDAAKPTLGNNHVIIDGVIYDLTSFQHPGGESIFVFGGNDATVTYKMIHPHHTSKNLEKMKVVGKVPNWQCEYKFDTPFEQELKREVFKIVPRGQEFGTPGYFFRAICYVSLFFYLQFCWMQQTSYQLAAVYGVSMALIGLNVQHDANHGAASRKHLWINDILGLGADFIGGSKWLWMEKHWTHHTYTNHKDMDPDGFAAEPFVLFNDYPLGSPKRTAVHAYQGIYMIVVLCGYWISAVFDLPQILYLKDSGATKVGMHFDSDWVHSRTKYAISLRILYYICNIVIPLYNDFSWTTVSHINFMGIAGSLTLGCLFTVSHNFENADRDPTASFRATGEPVCWFKTQVETSATYGGFISGCLTGGLNFQIEHHLFPRMSSAWYPFIAPTVREVCRKHNVRYVHYPWLWQNMISTVKFVHQVGNGLNWKPKGNPFKGDM
eukprot:Nitzschia sp. Nitz4//scaffold280_size24494//934//2424//NITZ4_008387-RA/size24494-snap-gene-0.37-mRNA-1//-1//CDS//3329545576//7457//frame0